MPAGESLSLTVRDLLAQIAPHVDIDGVYQGDPGRISVTVVGAGGSPRTLQIARDTLHLFCEGGLTPDVVSALQNDPATRWIMEEAEREVDPEARCHRVARQRPGQSGTSPAAAGERFSPTFSGVP